MGLFKIHLSPFSKDMMQLMICKKFATTPHPDKQHSVTDHCGPLLTSM